MEHTKLSGKVLPYSAFPSVSISFLRQRQPPSQALPSQARHHLRKTHSSDFTSRAQGQSAEAVRSASHVHTVPMILHQCHDTDEVVRRDRPLLLASDPRQLPAASSSRGGASPSRGVYQPFPEIQSALPEIRSVHHASSHAGGFADCLPASQPTSPADMACSPHAS